LTITCGIDWAQNHDDVAPVDEARKLVAKLRTSDDVQGYPRLLELLAEAGDSAGEPVPVAVETARGAPLLLLSGQAHGDRRHAPSARPATPDRPAAVLAPLPGQPTGFGQRRSHHQDGRHPGCRRYRAAR
jgi:hypothetical protein